MERNVWVGSGEGGKVRQRKTVFLIELSHSLSHSLSLSLTLTHRHTKHDAFTRMPTGSPRVRDIDMTAADTDKQPQTASQSTPELTS